MDFNIGRFLKFFVILIILAAIGWLIYILRDILTLLIISALLAYILDPVATHLEYRGLSRALATTIIFVLIAAGIFNIVYFFIPPLIDELAALQTKLDTGATQEYVGKIKQFLHENLPFLSGVDIESKVNDGLKTLTESFFAIVGNLVSIITTLVVIPFAVFFLLKDGQKMKKGLVSMIPNHYFEMTLNLIHKTDRQIGGYLRGQFFDALIIGILSVIALGVIGVKYFVLIGIFAGLSNMIPYVGPIAGASAAIVVSLVTGGSGISVLYIAVSFVFIQLADEVLVQPLVVAKSIDLHPLTVIFAVIIGGEFFGLLGMLLAVPLTGIVKVTSAEIYQAVRKYHLV